MRALFFGALQYGLHRLDVRRVHPDQPHQVTTHHWQPDNVRRAITQSHSVPLSTNDAHPLPLAAPFTDEIAQGNGHHDQNAYSPQSAGASGCDVITHADTQGCTFQYANNHPQLRHQAIRNGDSVWGLPGWVCVLRCDLLWLL